MSIKLEKISTRAPDGWKKKETKRKTEAIIDKLVEQQNLLFAGNKFSVLVILQGMDASGKDGVLRKVFSRINPRGLKVHSFDVPTEEEAAHDFLWRVHSHTPGKGMIQVFNRSQYDSVLVTRVHGWCSDETARLRMESINAFEQLLQRDNYTHVLKFYLHVSKEEQEERLQDRMDKPHKHWKFNVNDFKEVAVRDQYVDMYEDVFKHCNKIPWTIVPADQNWYKEHIVASTLLETLESLEMQYPDLVL